MKKLPEANHLKMEVIYIKRDFESPHYVLRVYNPAADTVLIYDEIRVLGAIPCFSKDNLLDHIAYALSALPSLPDEQQSDEKPQPNQAP